jgi:site-specific recombinase XerD
VNAPKVSNLYLKRGSYWFARQVGGVRKWVNLQTAVQSEAIRKAAEIVRDPLVMPEKNLEHEIRRFVAYKLRMNQYSRQSADTKAIALRQFAASVPGSFTSRSVNREHVQRFYGRLQGRVTESTAHGYMMSLRSFFRWCVEVERTRLDNPVEKVRLARHDQKGRLPFCAKDQKNELIANAPDDDLRFILFCGFDAGLRRGEIVEARAGWFTAGTLHVRKTATFRPKDREERSIPLTRPFARFLKRYLKSKKPDDFALHPEIGHGRWRYRYDFRRPFGDYMKERDCAWITPHVMRHSFASILATEGISIFKISEWMGDSVRVVQRHYAKLSPEDSDIHALS